MWGGTGAEMAISIEALAMLIEYLLVNWEIDCGRERCGKNDAEGLTHHFCL